MSEATLQPTTRPAGGIKFDRTSEVAQPRRSVLRVWMTRCGRYRVREIQRESDGVSHFYAERRELSPTGRPVWLLISGHRQAARAFADCRRFHREQSPDRTPPKG